MFWVETEEVFVVGFNVVNVFATSIEISLTYSMIGSNWDCIFPITITE